MKNQKTFHEKDKMLSEIMQQAQRLSELSDFSEIKMFLSNIPKEARKNVVDEKINGKSYLFRACSNNDVDLAKFLLEKCNADTEVTETHVVEKDNWSEHVVPPLWYAAITDKLDIAKLLVEHGANVNGCSRSNSTALRAACYNNNLAMVEYLIENGADISIPNNSGCTCLMNSVESPELCEILIEKGADVHAVDLEHMTALHYAVNYNKVETVKVMLKHGSDINAKDRDGLTPILLSALSGNREVINFFLDHNLTIISDSDKLDAMEILGVYVMANDDDLIYEGLWLWKQAMEIRISKNIPKMLPEQLEIYGASKEPESLEELSNIDADDVENLYLLSMMVYHRVLSTSCEYSINESVRYAWKLQKSRKHNKALRVYKHAYQHCLEQSYLLSDDCIRSINEISKILKEDEIKNELNLADELLEIFESLVFHISCAKTYLHSSEQTPKNEYDHFYQLLFMSLDFIIRAGNCTQSTNTESSETLSMLVKKLIDIDQRGSCGQSLIHLVVNTHHPQNKNASKFSSDDQNILLMVLTNSGADINSVDGDGNTPLWYHVQDLYPDDDDYSVLNFMLNRGAHIDMCNNDGNTPLVAIKEKGIDVCQLKHRTLQCLTATVICQNKICYDVLPINLVEFVKMHGMHSLLSTTH